MGNSHRHQRIPKIDDPTSSLTTVKEQTDKECQTSDYIQSMQSNKHQEPLLKMSKTISNDSVASDERIKTEKMSSNDYNEEKTILKKEIPIIVTEDIKTDNPDDNSNKSPSTYSDNLKTKFSLGLHKVQENFIFNFWVPETPTTLRDFIEVHSIPIYDLKTRSSFSDYCIKNKWFNTASKFKSAWDSIRLNPTRIIIGVRSKFDVHITISDCFFSDDGQILRAYSLMGGSKTSVLRSFGYLSATWKADFFLNTRIHHDALFQKLSENFKMPPLDPCGNLNGNIDFENTTDYFTLNNMNSVNSIQGTKEKVGCFSELSPRKGDSLIKVKDCNRSVESGQSEKAINGHKKCVNISARIQC